MKRNGRPRKPTNMKKAAGNPGKRPLNEEDEPEFEQSGYGHPPKYLNDYARNEWLRMAPLIEKAGVAPDVALTAFEAYCVAYGDFRLARVSIKRDGLLYKRSGYETKHPAIAVAYGAMEKMLSFMTEFGLTPSSATRVKADKTKQAERDIKESKDPWEKITKPKIAG